MPVLSIEGEDSSDSFPVLFPPFPIKILKSCSSTWAALGWDSEHSFILHWCLKRHLKVVVLVEFKMMSNPYSLFLNASCLLSLWDLLHCRPCFNRICWAGRCSCSNHIHRGLVLNVSPHYVCSSVICLVLWEFRLCALAWLCHIYLILVSLLSCRDFLGNRKQKESLGETTCRESWQPAKSSIQLQEVCKQNYFLSTSSCFLQKLGQSDRFSILVG